MASIRKRGKSYQITVSNGRDIHDKQILESTTWTPDPNKTDKQNQRALERFAMDFEDRVRNGKYLDGERYNATHKEPLPDIPLHGLRHTSATLLISQNIDVRTVSNRLGHAQTSTTMNIYSHSLQKKDEAAAETLETLLVKKSC